MKRQNKTLKTNFKKQNGYGDIRKNSKKMVQIGIKSLSLHP